MCYDKISTLKNANEILSHFCVSFAISFEAFESEKECVRDIQREIGRQERKRESGETILVNERKKMSSETSIHRSWDTFFRHKGKTIYGVDSTYLPRLVGYNLLRVIE